MIQSNSLGRIIQYRLIDTHMRRFKQHMQEVESDQFLTENWKDYDWEVAYLYQQQMPLSSIKTEITASHGPISYAEIYRSLQRNGIAPNRRKRPQHDDVLYFGDSGMNLEEISKLTGYSVRHVRNILNSNSHNLQD